MENASNPRGLTGSSVRTRIRNAGSVAAAAIDRLITPERLKVYPIAFGTVTFLILFATILRGDFPRLPGGGVALPDYLAHWTGGRLLLDGSTSHLYDPSVQRVVQHQDVGPGPLSWFISPPFATLMYAPFAAMNYGLSALVWTILSVVLLLAAIRLMRPFAPRLFSQHLTWIVVIVLSTQPVFEAIGSGQDSALSLLIWVFGIRLMLAGRDVPAGIVFALGLFKPQQFILIPIVLLIQRRFRALASWFATAGILAAASVAVVGVDGVKEWLRLPSSEFYDKTVHVAQAWKMQGLPALVTTLFPSEWSRVTSTIALGVVAIAAIFFIRQVVRSRTGGTTDIQVWMLAMLATVVVSPHLFIYDLVLVLVPILYLIEHHNTRTVRVSCVFLFFLTWTVPLRHVIAGTSPWPLSLIEAAWTAIPLVVLWVVFARALGLARTPQPISS